MDADYHRWLWAKSAERCVKNLKKSEFDAHYFPDVRPAAIADKVAAPMRDRSLSLQNPCAENGRCTDCQAPQRICRITTITVCGG